jgi:BatD DUF11 like domain
LVRAALRIAVRLALPWLFAGSALAAELTVQSEVDAPRLGVEDVVQLTITVSGSGGEDVPMPALTNLRVVGSPSVSEQVSLTNGGFSRSRSTTYVLQPQAPGRAEVGAVTVRAGNEQRTAPAIALEVVGGSILQRRRQAAPDPLDPFGGEDPLEALLRRRRGAPGPEPKVFLEAAVHRNRVYVGEPVLLTYYVYTQTTVTDLRVTEAPKYGGVWSEDLPQPKQPGGEPATVNGESYRRVAVSQKLLFPTKTGTITIPQLTAQLGVARGGGLLGAFPGSMVIERSTKPVTITVLPIPETPDFSGAVGRFTASATLDKDTVPIGDAATLRFEVKGEGNLKWVDKAPELSVTGAKMYPPQVKSDLRTTPEGITGSKTWEFIVVPETGGTIAIPALSFSFFDPTTGQLAKAVTAPLELHAVGPAALSGGAAVAPAPAAVRTGGSLALRSDLDVPGRALPPIVPRVMALAVSLVLAVHAAFFGAAWLSRRSRVASGRPTATRNVRRALSELARAGHDGLSKEAAVALIERTLHEVFGPLEEGTTPETERERAARQVLQEVYFIRYAPQLGDYSEKIRDVARRAEEVVRRYA